MTIPFRVEGRTFLLRTCRVRGYVVGGITLVLPQAAVYKRKGYRVDQEFAGTCASQAIGDFGSNFGHRSSGLEQPATSRDNGSAIRRRAASEVRRS